MLISRFFAMLGIAAFVAVPLPSLAQAAPPITLSWAYTQNPQRLATTFVVQRCLKTTTPCTPSVDLPGATAIPVATLSYVDTTGVINTEYCYAVMAADSTGRSIASPVACAGSFLLNAPTTLKLTIQ